MEYDPFIKIISNLFEKITWNHILFIHACYTLQGETQIMYLKPCFYVSAITVTVNLSASDISTLMVWSECVIH